MSDLMMVVTDNAPPALRGRLSLWLVEIRSGVYVGVYSVKVREYIWETIKAGMMRNKGNVVLVWKDKTDLGFSMKTIGVCPWKPMDFDGVTLMGYVGNNNE